MKELEIYNKITDLIDYSEKYILSSFPKEYTSIKIKFVDNLYNFLENCIKANVNENNIRNKFQKEMLTNIYLLDYYIEVIKKKQIIISKRYLSFINKLLVLNKLLNGWIKSEKNK